jgi:hypothetical protein
MQLSFNHIRSNSWHLAERHHIIGSVLLELILLVFRYLMRVSLAESHPRRGLSVLRFK